MTEYKYQRLVFKEIQRVETSLKVLDGYNKTGFNKRKDKNEAVLEESAKYAHDNQLIYFVTVLEDNTPQSHIEINKKFFRVYFLDEFTRNYMSYSFSGNDHMLDWQKEIPEDKLFLSTVTMWEYEGISDKVIKTTSYNFKPDGSLHVIVRDAISNKQLESKAKNNVDLSANWAEYPSFGNYEGIIEKERDLISPTD